MVQHALKALVHLVDCAAWRKHVPMVLRHLALALMAHATLVSLVQPGSAVQQRAQVTGKISLHILFWDSFIIATCAGGQQPTGTCLNVGGVLTCANGPCTNGFCCPAVTGYIKISVHLKLCSTFFLL